MDTLGQFEVYMTRLRDANSRKHSFIARLKTAYQPRCRARSPGVRTPGMLQIGLPDRYTRQVANQQVSAIAGVPMPTPGK